MSDAGKGYLYTSSGSNASVSPASVDFRTHFPGTPPKGPVTVTLTNTNFGDLTVTGPYRITGPNSTEFYTTSTPPSSPLAMYESTNIELYFNPDSLGTKLATSEIDTNDPDTPTTTVPLSGEAVEPPYCGLGSMYAKSDGSIVHADPSDGDRTVILDVFDIYAAPTLIFGLDIYDAYDLVTVTYLTQHTIMKVDRITGTKSIISYTGTPFYEPITVCVEADKKILVADNYNGLLRLDPVTGNVSTLTMGLPGWHPGSMDLEDDGDIVVADSNNYMILRFNPVSGALSIVPGSFLLISHIAVLPDGDYVATGSASNLYISPIVYRVNPTTGAKTLISGESVGSGIEFLDEDMSIAIDPSGNIVVFDQDLEALIEVDPITGNRNVISSYSQGVGNGPDLLNGGTHYYFTHLAIDNTGTPVSVNESSWNLYE